MSAAQKMVERMRKEVGIHESFLLAFLVLGCWHGFTWPLVAGIVALLLIHYRADFLPQKPVQGAVTQDEFNALKADLTKLSAALAFKFGVKPKDGASG